MANDKRTIGLTPYTREVMNRIMETSMFKDQLDVARLAMALAINCDKNLDFSEGAETVWNVGSFDPDGEIRNLISALFPDVDTPYRHLEYLVNAGLKIMGRHLAENKEFDIVDLMKLKGT